MGKLLTIIPIVFNTLIATYAVPVDFEVRPNIRYGIIMPGVSLKRIFIDTSPPETLKLAPQPPLVFGSNQYSSDNGIPISFGEPNEDVPVNNAAELIPVISTKKNGTSSFNEEISVPNVLVHFPSEEEPARNPGDPPIPAAVAGDEGSGDSFLFPSTIKVDLESPADDPTSNVIKKGVMPCGPQHGTLDVNGTCTRFLARSGCPVGEWFVRDDIDTSVGVCVPRPCPFGQLLYRGACVSAIDENVCSEGQMLYVDFTGYVHCDCQPNFIYDPWSGKCYAQGDRGHCNFGEYLSMEEDGVVQCTRNPCMMEGLVFHNNTGRCFTKQYRGFCDQDQVIPHLGNMTAECRAIAIHSIFDLPTMRSCAGGSLRGYAGSCREQFRVPAASSYPVLYGACPGNFIKGSRGTCRKTHRLFG